MQEFKAVIIGCGSRGEAHGEAYTKIPGARLSACFSPNAVRRESFAKRFGIKAYSSAGEMIEKESPDIASITTYPDVRPGLMKLVSEHGIPLCLVEKPLACGVKDWRELCELEKSSKTKFAVSHQLRWHKNLLPCAEALRSGRLGRILLLDLTAGMNISGQGTHTLNYGMLLNGDSPVQSVFGNAQGWDKSDAGHPAPMASEAVLTFENGVRALWTSGHVSPRAGNPKVHWQHVRVAAYAEKGHVEFQEFGKWRIVGMDKVEGGDFGGMESWKANNDDAQIGIQTAMFDWFNAPSKVPGTNLRQSLHEWAVVLALYQSALEGRPVEMKDFTPPDNLVERFKSKMEL